MNESILTSVKKMLGIEEGYEYFDQDIIIHINSALATLSQLGVGPEEGFIVEDSLATWGNLIDDEKLLNFVPTYVYLKVRLGFDPPTSASVLDSMERQASQYEWRISVAVDKKAES